MKEKNATASSKKDSEKLSDKQERFCREYIIDLNATQAAIRAGYSPKTANAQAAQMLSIAKVEKFIKNLQAKIGEELEISAERVIKEFAKIGFADLEEFYDENGQLKPVKSLKKTQSAAIKGIKVRETTVHTKKGGKITKVDTEFILHDKLSALESLGRHLGIYEKDNKQKDVTQTVIYLPDNGRDQPQQKTA